MFLYLLVVLPFFLAWLPGGVKYLLDVAWVWVAVFLVKFWRKRAAKDVDGLALWVFGFWMLTAAVYLVRFQSVSYYLWGFRNNFRMYAAFFGFALFCSEEERGRLWRWLDGLFWVNFWVSLAQFFGFGLRGDYLGGLFGTEKGCNGATNVFFVLIVAKSVAFYLDGREKTAACLGKCLGALLVAALAELKFFFVEFCVILVLAMAFSGDFRRKAAVISVGILGAGAAALLLYRLFPEFGGWFSAERMLGTAAARTGYAAEGDLNRLTALAEIDRRVFSDIWQRIFGLGLGNCDYSAFDFLTTPFYRAFSTLHYTWMSHSFLYLETGWMGLLSFFGFFVLVFFACLDRKRAECKLSAVLAAVCLLIGVYNDSLRTEAGFLMAFGLAQGFGGQK